MIAFYVTPCPGEERGSGSVLHMCVKLEPPAIKVSAVLKYARDACGWTEFPGHNGARRHIVPDYKYLFL